MLHSLRAAWAVIREVHRSTRRWRQAAEKLGVRKSAIQRMASAFEHADARAAAGY